MDTKQHIISFLKEHLADKPAIIGISGGIDSALVATLAVATVGKERVHGILMPSDTNTSEETARANELVSQLGVETYTIPIDPIVSTFTGAAPFFDMPLAVGNMKARVRMTLLYAKANQIGGLVLGTGNKTELLLGYFTKYGDAGVDVLPIASLYKHEVRALAKEMGVPQSILDAAPTAGLWAGQTDEQELGMTYHDADAILHALEKDAPLEEFDEETIAQVEARMHNSEHKRYLPPICELT